MYIKNEHISAEKWSRKGSWANVKGHKLFYMREGKGEILMLLHAYPVASYGWHKVWPSFTHQYECLAPDLIGNGFSDKPINFSYQITILCDIVEEWLMAQEVKAYHLFAHAYGVSTAQELLARQVLDSANNFARIKSVCFLSGAVFPELAHINTMQKFLLSPVGKWVAQTFPTPYSAFKKNFSKTFGPDSQPLEEDMREYWHVLTYNDGHKRVPQVIKYLTERLLYQDRWVEAMKKAEIPVGFLNAVYDPILGKPMSKRWKEELPRKFIWELKEPMGHYPPLEAPEKVVDAYMKFRTDD